MMHVPSPSDTLIHSWRRSIGQVPPVSPAKQTWAQLQVYALVILALGFLGQQGALLTWLLPERMPWYDPLPCPSLVVEDDSRKGDPPGVMALPVGASCAPPATVFGTLALTHTCFWSIRYLKRPRLLTRL
jgi:hypothetical protein